ncbi:MAG: ACP S-malonyltransferase [Eubacteriales bacterium]
MGKIALLFAGQGAQTPGMGRDLYEKSPAAKKIFDMGEANRPGTLATCFEGTKEELTLTENTQPCLFLTDLACAYALTEAGVKVDGVAGFSLGEIAALAFAGVLFDNDAFRLVTLRGEKMAECAARHPGGMAAVVKLSDNKVEELAASFDEVWPVNYNCPGQVACAGKKEQIAPFCDAVKAAGGRGIPLAVSGAFHTPYMQDATKALAEALTTLPVSEDHLPIWSNLTGDLYPASADEIRSAIAAQASNSVRWADTLRKMQAEGYDTFIEVGAGKTLSGLVAKTLTDVTIANVADVASLEATLSALQGA